MRAIRHGLLIGRTLLRTSAKFAISSNASEVTTSCPTRSAGRSALTKRAARLARTSSVGRVTASIRVDWPRSTPFSSFRTSPGRDRKTGPVGGVVAILAARRTILGMSSSRVISVAHFTSGVAIGTSGS